MLKSKEILKVVRRKKNTHTHVSFKGAIISLEAVETTVIITLREKWKEIFKYSDRKQLPTYNFVTSQNISQNEEGKTSPYAKIKTSPRNYEDISKRHRDSFKRLPMIESGTI